MHIITQPGNARKKPWPRSGRCAALSWASLFVKGNQRFSKAFHFARKMPGKAGGRQQTGIRIESESRGRLKSDPRQSRGLRKPCRQASQEALNTLSFASPAPPPPVNGIPPIACCISLVLNTIPLRSKPAAKALLLSPAQLRGVVLLMQPRPPVWPGALGMCKRAACRQAVNGHCFFRISLFLSAKLLSAFRPARSLKRKPFYPHGTAAERRFDKRKSR